MLNNAYSKAWEAALAHSFLGMLGNLHFIKPPDKRLAV
jgi:hypothetical protein